MLDATPDHATPGHATPGHQATATHDDIADDIADDIPHQVRSRLAALAALPVDEHVAAYDEVHLLLQDALARVDEG